MDDTRERENIVNYLDLKIAPMVKLSNQSLHLPPLPIWCCSIIMLMDSIRGYL